MRFLTLISTILFIFSTLGALAEQDAPTARITVIGSGAVSAAPDQAVITLGARHFGKSAAEALAQTSKDTAAILSRLQSAGVPPSDMQTSSLSLNPVWGEYRRSEDGAPLPPVGFEASNQVTATLNDLSGLGELLDLVAQDGANSFSGFRFGLSDPAPYEAQARTAAIADARAKAAQYARDAGLTLGAVVLITEEMGGGNDFPPPIMEMAAARSAPVPVAAGEITISRSIKVIFSAGE